MQSSIKTYTYEDGNIQRVQVVSLDSFSELDFIRPEYHGSSFDRLCALFRDFIVKKYEKVLGKLVIFRLPEDESLPFDEPGVYDSLCKVTMAFRKAISSKGHELVFSDSVVKAYFERLQESGDLLVVSGKRDTVSYLPFGKTMGFLSQGCEGRTLSANCSFFTMDQFDCSTVYDRVGVPLGLAVKDGVVLNIPQFGRQALVVDKSGNVSIQKPVLRDLEVIIDGHVFRHNENCYFYERPQSRKTPRGGLDIVVCNNSVFALKEGGRTSVPSGGFVIKTYEKVEKLTDLKVSYRGFEHMAFAVQVGNSAVVEGKKTERFLSPFYKFWNIFATSFPPCMYPLSYEGARAPRMVLGADKDGHPMLLWFEGAAKFGHKKGQGSCGASLSECASIAKDLGLYNAVHLDGGGSSQILLGAKRVLRISDRKKEDFTEVERAIPMGLVCEGEV